jgi:hypothetical protein
VEAFGRACKLQKGQALKLFKRGNCRPEERREEVLEGRGPRD